MQTDTLESVVRSHSWMGRNCPTMVYFRGGVQCHIKWSFTPSGLLRYKIKDTGGAADMTAAQINHVDTMCSHIENCWLELYIKESELKESEDAS